MTDRSPSIETITANANSKNLSLRNEVSVRKVVTDFEMYK